MAESDESNPLSLCVWIKGGGDLGTGVACSLHRVGMRVVITELPQPLVIRRMVSLASALYMGSVQVEDVCGVAASGPARVRAAWQAAQVPVMADPSGETIPELAPDVLVDATLAKRPTGTQIGQAPLVVALGPGFVAGEHAHAVIETMRGHDLGRILTQGKAQPDTGIPGEIAGHTWERVLRAPQKGIFQPAVEIGQEVTAGQLVARVDATPIVAKIGGVVRGLLWSGLSVTKGQKVGDIDPRGIREHCFTISDKSRAIGRAVLEAILWLHARR